MDDVIFGEDDCNASGNKLVSGELIVCNGKKTFVSELSVLGLDL